MTLDPNNIRAWVAVITLLMGLTAGVLGYLWRRSNVNNDSFDKLKTRVGDAERRLGLVEQKQSDAPSSDHIDELRSDIGEWKAEISQQLGKLQGEMSAVNRHLTIIQQALTKVP